MDEHRLRSRQAGQLTIRDLVFLGFNSRVVALDRERGDIVWTWRAPKGRASYVAVLLDEDRLFASVDGYTYCLHPLDGHEEWFNPLKGLGTGIPSLASSGGGSGGGAAAALEAQRQRNASASNTSAGT